MKLWGGRFKKDTDRLVEEFTASLPYDLRLYKEDIEGSLAHVSMLAKCEIISQEEAAQIKEGLGEIFREIKSGKFEFDLSDEDIHTSIERALIDKIGPVGGKLHTARSRNDQVTLDMRMHLKEEIAVICQLLIRLQKTLLKLAKDNLSAIMPGYTHLQKAQPVLFSHHLMAYFFMLGRDFEFLKHCFAQTDVMPLGSAALAGTSFAIDRQFVADELGFSKVSPNSMDAVSDRDFVMQFLSAASLVMVHLSRLCEELIIWSTAEFDFIELDDAFTTGSSIMPQKKNPDVAELIRAKAGRVFGNLMGLLAVLKSLPLAYNKDLQEDKEALFDSVDTLKASLKSLDGMLATMKINAEQMKKGVEGTFITATDLADYLACRGMSFRESHEVVGKVVKYCLDGGLVLTDLSLKQLQKFSRLFDEGALKVIQASHAVEQRKSSGGTSSEKVKEQLYQGKDVLVTELNWLKSLAVFSKAGLEK